MGHDRCSARRQPVRRRGRLPASVALAGVLALAISAAGCTSVRNGLGTRAGLCFAALPPARALVGPGPVLAGVRYLDPAVLRTSLEAVTHAPVTLPDELADAARTGACLVAYDGRFGAGLLRSAWLPEPGRVGAVVVVVRQSDDVVLGVVGFRRLPLRLAKLV